MYVTKKKEIINDLKKILKEKYNININESVRKDILILDTKYEHSA